MNHTLDRTQMSWPAQVVAALALAALAALALPGCGGDSDDGDDGDSAGQALLAEIPTPFEGSQVADTYVGKIPGTEFLVAIIAEAGSDTAAAYLCNASIDSWLTGRRRGDSLELRGASKFGEVELSFSLAAGQGEVTLPDEAPRTFSARAHGDEEGVFRIFDDAGLRGWIRFDGEVRGFLRRLFNRGGSSSPPPPPPPTPADPDNPCVGTGFEFASEACRLQICEDASREYLTATTAALRQDIENRASNNGCTLNPFVEPANSI